MKIFPTNCDAAEAEDPSKRKKKKTPLRFPLHRGAYIDFIKSQICCNW